MERDYVKELKENILYKFLRCNIGCKIYWLSDNSETSVVFKCNSSSVYFYRENGTYNRFDMSSDLIKINSRCLLEDINSVIRVEKEFDGKWLPVWTSADGFIDTDFQNFAYIHGRYYTFKELEQIIEEVKSLKKITAKLKVY